MKTFRDVTNKKHSFFLIDYSKGVKDGRYRDNLDEAIIID